MTIELARFYFVSFINKTGISICLEEIRVQRLLELEMTIDRLRSRYGGLIVRRGIALLDRPLSDHHIKGENIIHPISYGGF